MHKCLHGQKLLRSILLLLANAIKYSPQGGNVNFALACEQGYFLHSRSGGIPSEDQQQMFEPFHRGKMSVVLLAGLGLTVVQKCKFTAVGLQLLAGWGTTSTVTLLWDEQIFSCFLSSSRFLPIYSTVFHF